MSNEPTQDDKMLAALIRSEDMAWERACEAIAHHRQQAIAQHEGGQGEPVALLQEHTNGDQELELYRNGSGCLTGADKAAGWTETPLYARLAPTLQSERDAAVAEVGRLRSEVFAILRRHEVSEQCFAEVASVTHAARLRAENGDTSHAD